ncbi:glutaredoxin family protein [Demequina sediminicola]|uniref:glutaredoxin family protein n=1 Tax=Demequina sediminicola TaxID=1095026 RepID=UPI0007861C1D|nr:glutaredoxin family protein [Demequina sediminicola]
MAPRVILYSRPGCHLCDDARATVRSVCAQRKVVWDEVDISADAALTSAYGEQIPVVAVDGEVVGFWRIDAERLKRAL